MRTCKPHGFFFCPEGRKTACKRLSCILSKGKFHTQYIIAYTFPVVIDNSGIIMEFCYALSDTDDAMD